MSNNFIYKQKKEEKKKKFLQKKVASREKRSNFIEYITKTMKENTRFLVKVLIIGVVSLLLNYFFEL